MSDKYFIYSKNQFKDRNDIERNIGRKFYAGTIIVKGKPVRFTQIVYDLSLVRYTDYKVVYQTNEDLDSLKYNMPYAE